MKTDPSHRLGGQAIPDSTRIGGKTLVPFQVVRPVSLASFWALVKVEAGQVVLLTGAPGGLGIFIARRFMSLGVRLALVAHTADELERITSVLGELKDGVHAFVADLREATQRRDLIARVQSVLGPVDILINNAGVEFNSYYHELDESQIEEVITVNLLAAMSLSRLVLPEMLTRGRGHIVNISSLAGKSGPAFQEPYAASKAGLVAFTMSFRASYRRFGVSASVVVPGFVETGIYSRLKTLAGRPAPFFLAPCSPERVANAVVDVIQRDSPEVIVNRYPIRFLLALAVLSPSFGEWVCGKLGTHKFFEAAAFRRGTGLYGQ
ncbi:MAG: SDR family oxidoreductase [Verrucomicrobiae bacterium]|nr:SDR family oxidoreductase [Verrucomicrobiae bacterium]